MAGVLAVVAMGVACDPDPPSPPTVFTVTATDDRPDALPGDGTCEATPGVGDCTLRAGVEEANALGPVVLHVPAGIDHHLDAALEVTGPVRILGGGTGSGRPVVRADHEDPFRTLPLHIAPGGSLQVEDVDLVGLALRVEGSAAVLRGELATFEPPDATLTVLPGGTALAQNTWLTAVSGAAVHNHGTLLLDHSTVGGIWEQPTPTSPDGAFGLGWLTTEPGAASHLRSSWIAGVGCQGAAPTSLGYNADSGTTCGLDGPTEVQGVPPMRGPSPTLALPSGPLVDAIPVGEAGCGAVRSDIDGVERPRDGDGDGTAACDIGARER